MGRDHLINFPFHVPTETAKNEITKALKQESQCIQKKNEKNEKKNALPKEEKLQ